MSLGLPEIILIVVIALIIFGPKKLPELGKSLGQALREFKKSTETITEEVKTAVDVSDIKEDLQKIGSDPKTAAK